MVRGFKRGNPIKFINNRWVYEDDAPITQERSCKRCGKMPTKEGYDSCLGYIEGAISACCGHGIDKKYIIN